MLCSSPIKGRQRRCALSLLTQGHSAQVEPAALSALIDALQHGVVMMLLDNWTPSASTGYRRGYSLRSATLGSTAAALRAGK